MKTTFDRVPVWELFTTGPSSVLFVKTPLIEPWVKKQKSVNAIDLNGKVGRYIPGSRVVHLLDENDKLVMWTG
jgi:hypothetical protein